MTPLFYYPTTVLAIDDDLLFLDGLSKLMRHSNLSLKYCQKIPEAIALLQHAESQQYDIANQYLHQNDNTDFDENFIVKDVRHLHELFYLERKREQISVVLVDYQMPTMTGIDFCKMIKDSPTKKILITGYDNQNDAISAFNDGLINAYIVKSNPDFSQKLVKLIKNMQHQYFQDISNKIGLIKELDHQIEYSQLFSHFFQTYQLNEFYAIDKIGSYLAADHDKNTSWFAVWSSQKLDEYITVASEQEAPITVIEKLKQKKHAVFLFSEKERNLPVADWEKYLFPIDGTLNISGNNYVYAMIIGERFSLRQ